MKNEMGNGVIRQLHIDGEEPTELSDLPDGLLFHIRDSADFVRKTTGATIVRKEALLTRSRADQIQEELACTVREDPQRQRDEFLAAMQLGDGNDVTWFEKKYDEPFDHEAREAWLEKKRQGGWRV